MTAEQIIKHFDNSISFAAYNLGFTEAAIRKWVKEGRVPDKTQRLVQGLTNGKLKANSGKFSSAKEWK
jgi:hypothetical protein